MAFRSTTPADHTAIAALLARGFHMPPGNWFENERAQAWKYWDPREGWEGSRSFVMESGGKMLAHGCVWPMPVVDLNQAWKGIYLIDWVADPGAPAGVGIALLQKVLKLGDAICAIGGSAETRAIMPRIGFKPYNDMWFAARPLRSMRQMSTHQHRNWKLPARLLRNSFWNWRAPHAPPRGWTTKRCRPRDLPSELWPQPAVDLAVGARAAATFEYLLASPWARFEFFEIRRDERPFGYFCLAFAVGQARVADIWINSRDPGDWSAAYLLAVEEARRHPDAAEITAVASVEWARQGMVNAGFRIFETLPVTFLGSGAFPGESKNFYLQMIDADFSFLHSGEPEYRT
jgi:hypothetical protein